MAPGYPERQRGTPPAGIRRGQTGYLGGPTRSAVHQSARMRPRLTCPHQLVAQRRHVIQLTPCHSHDPPPRVNKCLVTPFLCPQTFGRVTVFASGILHRAIELDPDADIRPPEIQPEVADGRLHAELRGRYWKPCAPGCVPDQGFSWGFGSGIGKRQDIPRSAHAPLPDRLTQHVRDDRRISTEPKRRVGDDQSTRGWKRPRAVHHCAFQGDDRDTADRRPVAQRQRRPVPPEVYLLTTDRRVGELGDVDVRWKTPRPAAPERRGGEVAEPIRRGEPLDDAADRGENVGFALKG